TLLIIVDMYRDFFECCILVFFFFQAEDGIRDDLVTGVQTCALPISRIVIRELALHVEGEQLAQLACAGPANAVNSEDGMAGSTRSEERRVGKECRSRWAPDR